MEQDPKLLGPSSDGFCSTGQIRELGLVSCRMRTQFFQDQVLMVFIVRRTKVPSSMLGEDTGTGHRTIWTKSKISPKRSLILLIVAKARKKIG